jgi:nitrogen-specific signal transduction histidine kinase/HAMP domain-containing protein
MGRFSEVSLYDTFGALEASTSDAPVEPHGLDGLFDLALNGEAAVSRPFADDGVEGAVMLLIPLLDGLGQVKSVLAGVLPLDDLWAELDTAGLKQRASVALLDAHGRVFVDTDAVRNPSVDHGHRVSVAATTGEAAGTAVGQSYVYAETLLAHADGLSGPAWTVLVLRPYSALGTLLGRHSLMHLLLGALGLLCAVAVGWVLTQRIYAPLCRAVEAAGKVNQGQLDVQVPEEGPSELASIASAFNHMTAEVRYHRHTMTTMVEARTRNLERAQKAQERIMDQLKASYESTDEGFLVVDILTGEILQHNKRISLLFGIAEEDLDALSGDSFREMLKTMFCEPIDFENRWNYYNENPGEEGREEWQLKRPRAMTLSVYTAPVRSEQKNVIMARLWMFRDVSELRAREEQLRQTQQMEAMSHIAGSMAHDFNNLLTVIIGNLTLAQMESAEDAPEQEYLAAAQLATEEASRLVQQLRGFSSGARMQTDHVNANRMVERVYQTVRQSMDHGVQVRLELDRDLWEAAADPDQMHQVFTNLLMDRMDALAAGSELWVCSSNELLTREDPRLPEERVQGEYVRMLFTTLSPDLLAEKDEKPLEPIRNGPQGRTGLGLSMAYGIMVKHAGWVASLGGGSHPAALAVYIPRSEHRSTPMTTNSEQGDGGASNGTVLIVDDESGVRRIAVSVLKRAGLATLEAGDGEEAIRLYEEHKATIGIVLLDLSMPKLSGRETLKALKQVDPTLPILLCSGYPVAPDDFERETGFRPDGIVQKPFDIRALPDQVRAAMGDHGAITEDVG